MIILPPGKSVPVYLLTDFGLADHYVAVMKSVILTRAPNATIIDISHDVPPFSIEAGAYLLESLWPWLPPGSVVCAVVDPGVGTEREAAVFRCDGVTFIGPNNGWWGWLPDYTEGRVLDRNVFWEADVSSTFHGRDIFAPCAAAVAAGTAWHELGRGETTPVYLEAMESTLTHGHIIHFDRFGNAITSLRGELLETLPHSAEVPGKLRCAFHETFGLAAAGSPLAYIGSSGRIEIAVREGNARQALCLALGDEVILHESLNL